MYYKDRKLKKKMLRYFANAQYNKKRRPFASLRVTQGGIVIPFNLSLCNPFVAISVFDTETATPAKSAGSR